MKKKEEVKEKPNLKEALADLRKKYGDSVVITGTQSPTKIESMSTGSFGIDYMLGGGLPIGRIIELYGEPSQGKSTISLFFAAQVQKAGGTVAYLDVENAYNSDFAKKLGVNTTELLISQPFTLEETFDIVRSLAESNAVNLIIVDSVASMVPKSELEGGEMLKDSMAVQARLLSKALRIITGPVARSKTCVIFINQTRSTIGNYYGPKEVSTGGKALKYYSSVRLQVASIEKIMESKDQQIGAKLRIKAVKNKVSFPFREATIDLYFNSGIDLVLDTIEYGEKIGVITKEGNTYSFGDVKLGVGKIKVKELISSDEKLYQEIRKAISKIKPEDIKIEEIEEVKE